MSSRRRRFATVGYMDESVMSNTFCFSRRVADYHPIDQSTGKCCPTSTLTINQSTFLIGNYLHNS